MWSSSPPEIYHYKKAKKLASGQVATTWRYKLQRIKNVTFQPNGLPEEIVVKALKSLDAHVETLSKLPSLAHQNILKYYSSEVIGKMTYLKMEAAQMNLDELRMKHGGSFKLTDFTILAQQIYDGLQYLHISGIVHQRMKPQNIVIYNDPIKASPNDCLLKLSDFGLGSCLGDIQPCAYNSPEQTQGSANLNIDDFKMSDIFSAGVVFYEMLTGKVPFSMQRGKVNYNYSFKERGELKCTEDLFQTILCRDGTKRSAFWNRNIGQWIDIERENQPETMKNQPYTKGNKKLPALLNSGETKAEYQRVEDRFREFAQPGTRWHPVVTRIEKVTNAELASKFERAKADSFGDFIDLLFYQPDDLKKLIGSAANSGSNQIRDFFGTHYHRTSDDGTDKNIEHGFQLLESMQSQGVFGRGIYFRTSSSQGNLEAYFKNGFNRMLLCRVLIGKSMEVKTPDHTLSRQKLISACCDSVFAPTDRLNKSDEIVIFDPKQVLPEYVVHYDIRCGIFLQYQAEKEFERIKLIPSKIFDLKDPMDNYCRMAYGHLWAVKQKYEAANRRTLRNVTYMELVVNKGLEAAFEARKEKFRRRDISCDEVLAFQWMPSGNVDEVLRNNLSHLGMHAIDDQGYGHVFSELPNLECGCRDGLVLFRILPGKECSGYRFANPSEFESRKFNSTGREFKYGLPPQVLGDIHIITETTQFVPMFVYHVN